MISTPTPRFATRPLVPDAGTVEDFQWRRELTLPYANGSITATRGNLEQTLYIRGATVSYCGAPSQVITRTGSQRTNTIGGATTLVKGSTFTLKKFPSAPRGQAAGGQPVTIITGVGSYTARVSGSLQALVNYFCAYESAIFDWVQIVSEHGTVYGPIGPSVPSTNP